MSEASGINNQQIYLPPLTNPQMFLSPLINPQI